MADADKKAKRGRQSAGDMVRSLALVMIIVLVVFFFAQPPHSDAKKLRVLDPTSDVQAFASAAPAVAAPHKVPSGWRSNVSVYDPDTQQLRVGWVTASGHYAEYAAAVRSTPSFVHDLTAEAPRGAAVDVAGTTWQEYRRDKAISLVRDFGTSTVVLGTLRDTATLEELLALARSLST